MFNPAMPELFSSHASLWGQPNPMTFIYNKNYIAASYNRGTLIFWHITYVCCFLFCCGYYLS